MQNLENTGYFQSETWAWCAWKISCEGIAVLKDKIKATVAFSLYISVFSEQNIFQTHYVILHPYWPCLLQIQISWELARITDITPNKRHNLFFLVRYAPYYECFRYKLCIYWDPYFVAVWLRFGSWYGQRYFSSPPHSDHLQGLPSILSCGYQGLFPLKQRWHSIYYLPPSSAKVKNARSYTSTIWYVFVVWCLIKHRNNFPFTFTILPSLPPSLLWGKKVNYKCLETNCSGNVWT
jgi:hypothetical protein